MKIELFLKSQEYMYKIHNFERTINLMDSVEARKNPYFM